jgi:tetratricopeptide (TPR) repeat protein
MRSKRAVTLAILPAGAGSTTCFPERPRRRALAGVLLALGALLAGGAAGATEPTPVRAWEEPITLPTYPVGPAEPNPMFYAGRQYQGAKGPVYPYPLLDQLSDTRVDRAWRALWLENEYVKLSVLPEIGGRIFSAVDKTNGYSFFYGQHVVKPALIGMLGAWISGGVEWNVLHHHRASTFMPVQSAIAENPDGSGTIWIGETERRHRMRWVIGITLRPGRSYVEVSVRMLDRTPLSHSILYFANPAVHANEGYQVLFPPDVAWTTFHAKVDFSPWPIARGRFMGTDYAPGTDLSWWKNHPKPISFFVYHSDLDFFGGYDHGRRAGVAHVADHETVPGKKLWEWGNGPDGRMWDGILTDEDGPYIELMAGGYSDNQPDYSWIEPGETKTLVHHWYPIRELEGLEAANLEGALNVSVEGRTARIAANSTSRREGARVRLAVADRTLFEEEATVAPDLPFVREVRLGPDVREEDLRLSLLSSDGAELVAAHHVSAPATPEPPPYAPPPAPEDVASVEELVLAGRRLEQFYNPYYDAEPYYREALRRDPGHSGAHLALGLRALEQGRNEDAERHFAEAVARLTANHTRARSGEAQYLHGLALVALGRDEAARGELAAASWDQAFAGPASLAEARLESAHGRTEHALDLLERVRSSEPGSTAALALQAALLRHAGRADAAMRAASAALDLDPLDPLAARERALARGAGASAEPDPALDATERSARRSLDEDVYALEAAHDYAAAGLLDDALAVLETRLPADEPAAAADPLVAYTIGALRERRGETDLARTWYRRGRQLPPDYCFPFRLESVGVLERAKAADPGDPRAPYYLGNLLYDLQPERAIGEWEKARALDPGFARVHRNLAFAYARTRDDLAGAIASQEKAVSIEKTEPRLYYELDRLLAWSKAPLGRRLAWLQDRPETVARRDLTRGRLARVQVLLGRLDDALETLATGRYHVWEGERGLHEVYVEARLERGRKRLAAGDAEGALAEFKATEAIPPNIEVGAAAGSHLAAVRYHEGLALRALGREADAEAAFGEASEAAIPTPEGHYWVGQALQSRGRTAEARSHFSRLSEASAEAVDEHLPLERRMAAREHLAHGLYLRSLGLLGLGRDAEARATLARALDADPDDVAAAVMLRSLPPAAHARPRPTRPASSRSGSDHGRPPAEAPPGRPPAEAPEGPAAEKPL